MKKLTKLSLGILLGLWRKNGMSYVKIGNLISRSDKSVKALIDKALRLEDEGKLREISLSEGEISLMYVGGTEEVEEIDSQVNHRSAGGGRRVSPVRYDDDE